MIGRVIEKAEKILMDSYAAILDQLVLIPKLFLWIKMVFIRLTCFLLCMFTCSAFSVANATSSFASHPFYMGLLSGYGSTTWNQIVPSDANQNEAMVLSTPTHVNEGGIIYGVNLGYELLPEFALELTYIHYPYASVYFSPDSLFTFDHNKTKFHTHTQSLAFIAKYMVFIPHTSIRAFSSVGPALMYRADIVKNQLRISPNFGVGFNYPFSEHWFFELAFNYTAGYGESELNPVNDYMPFVYSGIASMTYHF